MGRIGRSPAGAGILFDGLFELVEGNGVGKFPADDNLELVAGRGPGSEATGAMTVAAGFFVNLWWSVCDVDAVTEGSTVATGLEGRVVDSGRGTTGNWGASGR